MKAFLKIIFIYLFSFIVLAVAANLSFIFYSEKGTNTRNIVMNRIAAEYDSSKTIQKEQYMKQFGKKNYPAGIEYFSANSTELNKLPMNSKKYKTYIFPVRNAETSDIGFLVFSYKNYDFAGMLVLINSVLLLTFILILSFAVYVLINILKPFAKLQEYPKKLALGLEAQKLPESKNKYFGKYIWAMNMLNDVLENQRNKVNKLVKNKQVLISTFAHGIKTPVSNIKLYSNAIQTGLYTQNVNEKDVEIAGKIEKNAEDIQQLVNSILDNSTKSLFEYEPKLSTFYMKEIKDFIVNEYDNRLKVKKISYTIEQTENPVIKSDKSGICKILFQLMDNAIKYGDGKNIRIKLERQGENFYFSIINTGSLLPENEIPFVFNSFWRGSNAANIEGQGIGLYEAKQIAKKLGGDLFINYREEELEVLLVI